MPLGHRLALAKPNVKPTEETQRRASKHLLTLAPKPPISQNQRAESTCALDLCHSERDLGNQHENTNAAGQDDNLSPEANETQLEISLWTPSQPTLEHELLSIPCLTVCSALHANGVMQGISCLSPLPRFTPPGDDHLPLPLHPTPLQMTKFHNPYIDCFPMAKLRDNLLIWNDVVSEEEFCSDLITSNSFLIKGSHSWDPAAWIVFPAFKKKWWFLIE